MKSLAMIIVPLFALLSLPAVFAEPTTYPGELMHKIQEMKHSAAQKGEMPSSLPGIVVVNTAEAESLWKSNTATFLDTRKKTQYDAERIPGAEWYFSDDLVKNPEMANRLDKEKEYVLYCNGDRCWRAGGVALLLQHLGFKKILWYRGGLPDWMKKNLPTEKAAK